MVEHVLSLDENLSQSFPAMNLYFPYLWFWGDLDNYIDEHVPWHWHAEPELCYVFQGEVEYHLPEEVIVLHPGDAIFVNSNVLHMICPHNGCKDSVIIAHIFNKLLFTGYHHSSIDEKYFRPITNCRSLLYYTFHQTDPSHNAIIQLMKECYLTAKMEQDGYEVEVRNYISSIWIRLYHQVKDLLQPANDTQDHNNLRLIQMLHYINEHYQEKISLQEIADAACIGTRECIRCFKKCLQTTPFQYLLEYRIDAAANMLLHSEASITEIAMQTGFESSSHFSRTFKQYMQCTPKQYRDTSGAGVKRPFNNKLAAGDPFLKLLPE